MNKKTTHSAKKSEYHKIRLSSIKEKNQNLHDFIKASTPNISEEDLLSRRDYTRYLMQWEKGVLNDLEEKVLESIDAQKTISEDVGERIKERMKFKDKLADNIAIFGGSWAFIILAIALIIIWIYSNGESLFRFDPFPFILLNLFLTCVSALQAPFIMMSQNRQADRDRKRMKHYYQVNLKAEIEIRQVKDSLELFMNHYLDKMHDLYKVHEAMADLLKRTDGTKEDKS